VPKAVRSSKVLCPHCGAELEAAFIRKASGRLVGSIKGTRKALASEVARANVMVRWAKRRKGNAS
jgi:hypothetical protein